ncbi:predicted protein [Nematostella vectensis]|uniref:G-protein coupled receptors family 1 profile domain-containing protein n=1 Tax=Nematostella vectensis TaxID=45351 RepID=A7S855_NEMVE|nr:galanin receptor type 1 [Nematostella vectensis]EDO40132.1 predicted protein [Nematostella vectensis]|eukprot:XP_001632195.1 predicted protein [Nematostella vectensis]
MANPTNYASVTDTEKLVKLILYIIALIVGVTGNSLVLVILARKSRRVVNDFFIINLAVADLTLLIFSVPITVLFYEESRFTAFVCKTVWPMMTIANNVSIFTLTIMAVCRCHVILNAFRPDIQQTTVVRSIALAWTLAAFLLLPLIIVAEENPKGAGCEENWTNLESRRAYTASLVILQYVLPLVAIAIAYVWIGVDLWKPERYMATSWATQDRKGREKRRKENVQIVKTLATIVVLFAICMLPGHIAWMLADFGGKSENNVAMIILRFFDLLVYVHSCMNPIVYGTLTKYFRREYTRYFKFVFCCNAELKALHHSKSHHRSHEHIHGVTL